MTEPPGFDLAERALLLSTALDYATLSEWNDHGIHDPIRA